MNCIKIKELLLEYVEGNIDVKEKKEIDVHLSYCQQCRNELENIKNIHNSLIGLSNKINPPANFIDNIKNLDISENKLKANGKKYTFKSLLVACTIMTLSLFTVFASEDILTLISKSITKRESLKDNLNKGYGNELNISKIDQQFKVTLLYAVADDTETSIFYEVENLSTEDNYDISNLHGDIDLNKYWPIKESDNPMIRDSIPTTWISLYSDKKNVSKGKLTLPPIQSSEETINITFKRLLLNKEENHKSINGNWNFNFKVNKIPTKTYEINKDINLQGYPVKFTTVEMYPTKTVVNYEFKNVRTHENFQGLEDVYITCNGNEYEQLFFGGNTIPNDNKYHQRSLIFESLYSLNPNKLEIHVKSYTIKYYKDESFTIDPNKPFPQKFELLGSNMTVEKIHFNGQDIITNITYDLDNREFEIPEFKISSPNNRYSPYINGNRYWGFYIDENGNKYELFEGIAKISEIRYKKPVYYAVRTELTNRIFDIEREATIKEWYNLDIPIDLILESYTKTYFTDNKIKVKLK
ncbi:MAG: DUF5643 domain-containing protein [Clostridiaceae bacterium]